MVYVGQVARVCCREECVGQVKVDQLAIGWSVGRWVIDQVTHGVGVYVLGRHCDEVFVCDAFQFANLVVPVPQVGVVGARCWHGVRKLLLVIEPEAIMALEVRSQASFRGGGLLGPWFENHTWKEAKQSARKHYALSFA